VFQESNKSRKSNKVLKKNEIQLPTNTTQQPLASSSELSMGLKPYNTTTQQHNNNMNSTKQTPTLSEENILVSEETPTLSQISEQTQTLISENNILIEKMIAKLNNDLLRKIENLSNPTIIPKTRRTRTITPVSDDDRCTQTLVSGKNKGGKCSKKATKGSLCTMHHKKMNVEPVSVEPVSVEPVSVEPVSVEPVSVEPEDISDFMAHLQE
jgi:hypothetical protein